MIPPEFDYVAPGSLDEALQALTDGGEDAKILAGGHSLIPMMKLRFAAPSLLVDLRRVDELTGISTDGDIDQVRRDDPPPRRRQRQLRARRGRRAHDRRPAGPQHGHDRRHAGARRPGVGHAGDPAGRGGLGDDPRRRRRARRRGRRLLPGLPHDRGRRGRDRHLGQLPQAVRVRVRLPEVQPPPGGLGDGGRRRAGQEGRRRDLRGRAHRAHPHGLDAAARERGRGGAARPAADAGEHQGRGRARRRRHLAVGRPERLDRVQAAPRARADPARAGEPRHHDAW